MERGNGDGSKELDTTSFANVLAAVQRMRSETSAGGIGNSGGNNDSGERNSSEQANKRQKLPERAKPPSVEKIQVFNEKNSNKGGDHTSNVDNMIKNVLPPRVPKPSFGMNDTNTSNTFTKESQNESGNLKTVVRSGLEKVQPLSSVNKIQHRSEMQTFNQIQVSRSQTGNPLLEYLTVYQMNSKIKDVDYVINSKCIAMFLSLRYHKLHPEYIYNKLKKITYNHEDTLRVLLVYVDIEDFQDTVRELNKLCLFNKLTMILAWSNEQCANYLQNLKYVEKEASKRIIQGNRSKDDDVLANDGKFLERVLNTVSSVRSVSQSDAKSLLLTYGSMRKIVEAEADDLYNIEGLGNLKVDRLLQAFNKPFKT